MILGILLTRLSGSVSLTSAIKIVYDADDEKLKKAFDWNPCYQFIEGKGIETSLFNPSSYNLKSKTTVMPGIFRVCAASNDFNFISNAGQRRVISIDSLIEGVYIAQIP